jgi:hypothetical protein
MLNAGARLRLDQLPLDRIHDSFQPIVGPELLIDVVQVITEGLQADVKRFRDLGGILALGE